MDSYGAKEENAGGGQHEHRRTHEMPWKIISSKNLKKITSRSCHKKYKTSSDKLPQESDTLKGIEVVHLSTFADREEL